MGAGVDGEGVDAVVADRLGGDCDAEGVDPQPVATVIPVATAPQSTTCFQ